jgi:hypothetical protein
MQNQTITLAKFVHRKLELACWDQNFQYFGVLLSFKNPLSTWLTNINPNNLFYSQDIYYPTLVRSTLLQLKVPIHFFLGIVIHKSKNNSIHLWNKRRHKTIMPQNNYLLKQHCLHHSGSSQLHSTFEKKHL